MNSIRMSSISAGAVALMLALGQIAAAEIIVPFTTVGPNTWTAPWNIDPASFKVLVVAGGGGGGWHAGGGGGAGGLIYSATYSVSANGVYSITVGAGGARAINLGNPNLTPPTSGGNSSFDNTLTAVGGGYGAYSTWATHFPAAAGGSGGGGYFSSQFAAGNLVGGLGTSGQGNAGANGLVNTRSGGGGGAGAAGSVQNGGGGIDYSSIFGTTYGVSGVFAGGGGAGATSLGYAGTGGAGGGGAGAAYNGSASNGQANTGGGGGGGGEGNGICGNGGSGIVLLAYNTVPEPSTIALLATALVGLLAYAWRKRK